MAGGMAGRITTIITTITIRRLRLARHRGVPLMAVFIGLARRVGIFMAVFTGVVHRVDIFMADITVMAHAAESF